MYVGGRVLAAGVCESDRVVDYTRLWLHHFQEGEVLVICVLHSLALCGQLLADLGEVGSTCVQLLDCPLQALEAQDQRSDVVQRSTGGCSPDDYLNAIGRCLVLVVLAHSRVLALLPGVGVGLSSGRPLLRVVALAALVGAFTATHFQREVDLLGYSVPNGVDTVSVVKALENAVAADHDEVEVVLHLEALDVRVAHDYVWISSEAGSFCLDVAEGLRHR